ncbi:hypothetical protein [Candidatus Poriferisodalis sp.]|uniref:hypothetical protein n=1 Tax=Candidatus Poriferisodalis sp. TaxID=3101277 RepID=UPI003B01B822
MQFAAQIAPLLKSDEQSSSLADPRCRVRQRMGYAELIAEGRDKTANLVKPNLEIAPILAQESCF